MQLDGQPLPIPSVMPPAETRVSATLVVGNKKIPTVALVDTGNLLTTGLAVSAAFTRRHKLKYKPCNYTVGTAKQSSPLTVIGRLAISAIQMGEVLIKNQEAVVIEQLASPLNMGITLLTALRASIQLGAGQNKLVINGRSIPLIQELAELTAASTHENEAQNDVGPGPSESGPKAGRPCGQKETGQAGTSTSGSPGNPRKVVEIGRTSTVEKICWAEKQRGTGQTGTSISGSQGNPRKVVNAETGMETGRTGRGPGRPIEDAGRPGPDKLDGTGLSVVEWPRLPTSVTRRPAVPAGVAGGRSETSVAPVQPDGPVRRELARETAASPTQAMQLERSKSAIAAEGPGKRAGTCVSAERESARPTRDMCRAEPRGESAVVAGRSVGRAGASASAECAQVGPARNECRTVPWEENTGATGARMSTSPEAAQARLAAPDQRALGRDASPQRLRGRSDKKEMERGTSLLHLRGRDRPCERTGAAVQPREKSAECLRGTEHPSRDGERSAARDGLSNSRASLRSTQFHTTADNSGPTKVKHNQNLNSDQNNPSKPCIKIPNVHNVVKKGGKGWGRILSLSDAVSLHPMSSQAIPSQVLVFVELVIDDRSSFNRKFIVDASFFRDTRVQALPGCYQAEYNKLKIAVINLTDETQLLPKTARIVVQPGAIGAVHADEIAESLRDAAEQEAEWRETTAESCSAAGRANEGAGMEASPGIQNMKVEVPAPKDEMNVGGRMAALFEELKLEESEVLKTHPKVKKKLKTELYRLREVFSSVGDEVGTTEVIQCQVKLKSGTQPIRQKSRPLNPVMEADLRKQLQQWLRHGVVEPSKSPWSSPLVPVRKKDGTVRWAVDLRLVNQCIVGDSYPLPRIEQLLEASGGHRIYSSLDASSAYHTIAMSEEAKELTAFATPDGLFHYCRMPFGLCTAPAVYSRFIAIVLSPLGTKGLSIYLDDVLVFSDKPEEHLQRLVQVLEAHLEAGIKVKPAKTRLFQSSVQYLGHVLSEKGIAMVPEYIEKIVEWPAPRTTKQLSTFLGFVNYYRQFLQDYAKLVAPMTKQRKQQQLDWTEECEQNFAKLKEQFSQAPIRAVPVYDAQYPFKLTTDYSGGAVAAVLSQEQAGQERLIAAVGRKTTTGESNYSSVKGEIAAVVYGVRKFHHILSFGEFQLITDAAALKHLHTLKNTRGITGRWLQELAGYQFVVQHRAGKINNNADALSRSDHLADPTPEEEAEQASYVFNVSADAELPDLELVLSRPMIRQAQEQDELCKMARQWVSEARKPDLKELKGQPMEVYALRQQFEQLHISEDQLLTVERPESGQETLGEKIILPETMHGKAFYYAHSHPTAGHFGVQATLARQRRNFYFPGQAADIEGRVKLCGPCIQKSQKLNLKDVQHHPHRWGYPLEMLFVDLCGPLPKSLEGFQYILSVQDAYSRFLSVFPLRTKTSAEVTRNLLERFIGTFGCPMGIHSDNGTEFTAAVWSGLMKALEINTVRGPSYNPQSNSVERTHRTIHTIMRTCMRREDTEWPRLLPALQLAFNSKVNVSTGVTPLLAFTGREVRLPVDLMVGLPPQQTKEVPEQVRDMTERMKKMYGYIRSRGDAVIRRNAALYSGKKNEYSQGELIWYLCPRAVPGKPTKWTAMWLGPFRIVEVLSDVLVRIKAIAGLDRQLTVHLSRVRPYVGEVSPNTRVPAQLEVDSTPTPEAEELRGASYSQAPVDYGVPVRVVTHAAATVQDLPGQPVRTTPAGEGDGAAPNEESQEKHPDKGAEGVQPSRPADTLADEDVGMPTVAHPVEDNVMTDTEDPMESTPTSDRTRIRRRPSTSELTSAEESSSPELTNGAATSMVRRRKLKKKRLDVPFRELLAGESTGSGSEEMVQMLTVPVRCAHFTPTTTKERPAGFELESSKFTVLPAGQVTAVELGLQLAIPTGYVGLVEGHPTMISQGLMGPAGVVHPGDRQQLRVYLQNTTAREQTVRRGMAVAQLVLLPTAEAECCQEDQLTAAQRQHSKLMV